MKFELNSTSPTVFEAVLKSLDGLEGWSIFIRDDGKDEELTKKYKLLNHPQVIYHFWRE